MQEIKSKEHLEKISHLENFIRYQKLGLICLFIFSSVVLFHSYSARISNRTTEKKIASFKAATQRELTALCTERAAFIKEKEWKGRLTRSDAKEVGYYNEEIKQLECLNQAINLLEIKLSYP